MRNWTYPVFASFSCALFGNEARRRVHAWICPVPISDLSRWGNIGVERTSEGRHFPARENCSDSSSTIRRSRSQNQRVLGLWHDQLAGAAGAGLRFTVDLEAGKPTAQLGKALAALKVRQRIKSDRRERLGAMEMHLDIRKRLVTSARCSAAPGLRSLLQR